jgi:DNA polymerase-4
VPANPGDRTIAHLDVDAFYVSVECCRRPELLGEAVVVAGSGPRAVVTTASYEARRYGVGSAMPAAKARRLCPQAIFLAPDFALYQQVSRQLMALVRAATTRVEVVGLDEAYLDLTELSFPHAAMRRLVAVIAERTGLTCSVGIGPNKQVAKVASDAEKPAGFVVLTRAQACVRFAQAPPELIPGIGPKTATRLRELGVRTIEDLAQTPVELLGERFGTNAGRGLARMARFDHDGEVSDERAVVSASRERTFDHDLSDPAELERALANMARELCGSLSKQGRSGRTVSIKVRLDDFSTVTRARTVSRPTSDGEVVADVALGLLRDYRPSRPVRLLGVRVAGFGADAAGSAGAAATPERSVPATIATDQLLLPL